MALQTAALIVAGGRGTRAGGGAAAPKQYQALSGQTVLARTLAAFADHAAIDGVQVVIHPDDAARYAEVSAAFGERLLPAAHGGAERQDSVRAGLAALAAQSPRNVLIHDAVRPFVSGALIDRVASALDAHVGAVPGVLVADTLKREHDGLIAETVARDGLWAAQTPQGFRFADIRAAHDAAASEGRHDFTDDAAVAEWHGLPVALVEGEPGNVKLTTARDLEQADRLLRAEGSGMAGQWRVGQGVDAHAFVAGDHVMLCGVPVPHDHALEGHSDADAGLHALTDALLGAIGDGDIGSHFPPSDPQWQGAASEIFLRAAAERVRALGGRIANVDVTLICEAPKITPHRDAMRARIAEILEIDVSQVGVKATTLEGLGFTGRREGVMAQASASVWLP